MMPPAGKSLPTERVRNWPRPTLLWSLKVPLTLGCRMLSLIKRESAHKLAQTKAFPILVLTGAGILLTLPAIIYGIPYFSDDGVSHHALWYTHFSEQLWAGDLYPRWLMGMNEGLGSPVFYYYPPVPFFLTSLLKPFFPADLHGWHQLGLSASLALIASGFFAYLWLREPTDRNSALMGAVLYMAMPYHLASDLYVRGSFAEYWAFVWMPLVLFFTHKVVNGNRLAVAGLAVSYAALIMTHLPTTLIFSPIPICYSIYIASRGRKIKVTGTVLAAMVLGSGLSAVYLWPAMTTQQFVFLDRMTIGYFSYKNWLPFSKFSLWRDEKILVLLVTLNLAAIACCAFTITRLNLGKFIRQINAFWLIVALGCMAMMTELSGPVWLTFPMLQKIQFPWRFNSLLSIATAALLTLSIFSAKKRASFSTRITRAIAVLLVAAWLPATGLAVWHAYAFDNPSQAELDYKRREIEQKREVPEYYPRWNTAMADIDWEASSYEQRWDELLDRKFESLLHGVGQSEGSLSKVRMVEGKGEVDISTWKPGEIGLHITTPTGMRLYVSQFYYPNWKARLIGESSPISIQPSQPHGLISLSIPDGEHRVLLTFERGQAEVVGQVVSLLSLMIFLLYVVAVKYRQG